MHHEDAIPHKCIAQVESGVLPGGSVGLKMSLEYFCGKLKSAHIAVDRQYF